MTGTTSDEKPSGDLGRRLATRRAELGLSRPEAADRAGVAVSYLTHLEEHPGAAPGRGTLLTLAAALDTTVSDLTGGQADLPPGPEQASRTAEFTELDQEECRSLLGSHGVGRVAVPAPEGPVVVPVNYSVVDDTVVYRTASGTTPSSAAGQQVGFEVDRIDDAFGQGWSVLVRGPARTVTEPDEVRRLTDSAHSRPWAGGDRELWIRIEPRTITGRRITA
ncbi:helix-turn-helix domain-containing protein [Streptomyces sp. NPDC005017]|uniref:helix-turn-helix domain-containing protein n=1 Tax=Streptomyces sp. NPDC005017 TaxID=3364706 RepID=UPI003673E2B7